MPETKGIDFKNWDFRTDPEFVGTFIGEKMAMTRYGPRRSFKLLPESAKLDVKEVVSVLENHGLRQVFDAVAPGDFVKIRCIGKKGNAFAFHYDVHRGQGFPGAVELLNKMGKGKDEGSEPENRGEIPF